MPVLTYIYKLTLAELNELKVEYIDRGFIKEAEMPHDKLVDWMNEKLQAAFAVGFREGKKINGEQSKREVDS